MSAKSKPGGKRGEPGGTASTISGTKSNKKNKRPNELETNKRVGKAGGSTTTQVHTMK